MKLFVLTALVAGAIGMATPTAASAKTSTQQVICVTFKQYCSQALRVAQCESGMSVGARNGQYWGLFQLGLFARTRYGHAWNAWAEAQAAYRYFLDSGRDWSPWTCRP